MIAPELLHLAAEKICHEAMSELVVIGVFQSNHCELVAAARPDCAISIPNALRKLADRAEDTAPQMADRSGANQPGDVFIVNARAERWRTLLVIADEIHPWGIIAHATIPVAADLPPLPAPFRFEWPEINFVGRT